jgi:anti-sigma factor RsiW
MRSGKVTNLSDEILMAYADGQLKPAEMARIELLLASDPGLRARLEVFRATGRNLASLFDGHCNAPLPSRLKRFTLAPRTDWSKVFNLSLRRKRQYLPGFRLAAASAAMLAVGIGIGWLMHGSVGGDGAALGELARLADDRVIGANRSGSCWTHCRAVKRRCFLF